MNRKLSTGAFTLPEMMVSLTCGVFILAAVVVAGVSLQRSYAATENYSMAEAAQLRVLDYIAMDCRRATSATVTPVTVNGIQENALVLTLPTYYSNSTSSTAALNNPNVVATGSLTYGQGDSAAGTYVANTDVVTVTYQQNGNNFTRTVKVTDASGATIRSNVTTAIATNVSTFTVTPANLTKTVSCSILFFPNFLHNAGTGTWRSGQYTPNDRAPDDSVGVNGDWYALNNTVADPTQNGDVYFKSNGTYSKVQNVKATSVAIQTFLRNAWARQAPSGDSG